MWKDITIGQYQKLFPVINRETKNDADSLDKAQEICAIMEGKEVSYYEDMIANDFFKIFEKYKFLLTLPKQGAYPDIIEVKGIKFGCDYNPANVKYKLKARDIIDLTTIGADEKLLTENMHRIMGAYLIQEKPKKGERMDVFTKEEFLKDLDMQTASDILGFFFVLLESCSPVILDYLKTLPKQMKEKLQKYQ